MDKPAPEIVTAWVKLNRVQTRLMSRVEAALKAAGLPPLIWYDLLWELHKSGAEGLRQFEIGERTLLTKYNLSRLLDRITDQGYVARHPCDEDARGQQVVLTEQGNALLKRMWPVYATALQQEMGSSLSARQASSLIHLLDRLLR